MNALPQELVDSIIDYVAPDKPALLACSNVCHSFRARSRAHLFSTVLISNASECAQFHSLLSGNVAPLVRRFDILDPLPHDPRYHTDATWIAWDALLPDVVHSVAPYIHDFALTSQGYHYGDTHYTHVFRWSHASDSLRQSIAEVFQSPSIDQVLLAGVLIDSCQRLFALLQGSSLRKLSLPSFWHDSQCIPLEEGAPVMNLAPASRLESLAVVLTPCLVTYMLQPSSAVYFARLTELSIKVPSNCPPEIRSAASGVLTPSLQKLTIEESIIFGEIPQTFSLTQCTNLSVLYIKTRVYTMDNSYWTYISQMMETIAPHPSAALREIKLELDLVSATNSEWLDWTAFEQILAMPTMSKLERVSVTLNTWGHMRSSKASEVWIGKGLPALQEKGVTVGMRHRSN